MNYKSFPGAVPQEYVLGIVKGSGSDATVELRTQGPAKEGDHYVFVPIDPMPAEEGLQLGVTIATRASKPFFVELRDGAEWDHRWGTLDY
jgi:hypothetical protein